VPRLRRHAESSQHRHGNTLPTVNEIAVAKKRAPTLSAEAIPTPQETIEYPEMMYSAAPSPITTAPAPAPPCARHATAEAQS